MPEITTETVQKIARLANLKLTADEVGLFSRQLEQILEYIHKLNQLDTAAVPPTTHALPMQNVWRDDETKAGLTPEAALAGAPDAQEQCFRVPRIIE
ncbi:MAG: Asp-tRNA(Asn)/Glu-tRNA(Gln) amidotransferase subunit GatC [candidate division FCPU426 bacterium]